MITIPPLRPWFHNQPLRVAALETAVASWLGTPFLPKGRVKGPDGGVDCVHFIHEICVECGMIDVKHIPSNYTLDHARHSPHSLLLRWLLDAKEPGKHLVLVPPLGRLLPGDLLAIRTGLLDHHLAIALPCNRVAHSIEGAGPLIHTVEDVLMERVLYVARVLEQPAPVSDDEEQPAAVSKISPPGPRMPEEQTEVSS
jgi:hypothetical protein